MIEWRDIPSLDNLYQVSNDGQVRRKPGTYKRKMKVDGRVVKSRPDKDGYLIINFEVNRRRVTSKVHRLVAEAFIPNPMPEVNHIDGNKQNNHASNLEWCDRVQNIAHSVAIGKSPRGERSSSKLDDMQILTIYTLKGHTSHEVLGKLFWCSPRSIPQIQAGRRWVHLHKAIYN